MQTNVENTFANQRLLINATLRRAYKKHHKTWIVRFYSKFGCLQVDPACIISIRQGAGVRVGMCPYCFLEISKIQKFNRKGHYSAESNMNIENNINNNSNVLINRFKQIIN